MQNIQENIFRDNLRKAILKNNKVNHALDIDYRMQELVLRIEVKVAHLRSEILKWFIGVSLIQTSTFIGTILATLQFFHK